MLLDQIAAEQAASSQHLDCQDLIPRESPIEPSEKATCAVHSNDQSRRKARGRRKNTLSFEPLDVVGTNLEIYSHKQLQTETNSSYRVQRKQLRRQRVSRPQSTLCTTAALPVHPIRRAERALRSQNTLF